MDVRLAIGRFRTGKHSAIAVGMRRCASWSPTSGIGGTRSVAAAANRCAVDRWMLGELMLFLLLLITQHESKGAFIRPVSQESAVQMDEPLVVRRRQRFVILLPVRLPPIPLSPEKTFAISIGTRRRRFSALRIREAQLCIMPAGSEWRDWRPDEQCYLSAIPCQCCCGGRTDFLLLLQERVADFFRGSNAIRPTI